MKEEKIARILVAADGVALPLLREQLSPSTRELLTEVGGVDIKTPEADVFRVTLDAFREADPQSDQERVDAVLNAWRAGGLGTVGLAGVRARAASGRPPARSGNSIEQRCRRSLRQH